MPPHRGLEVITDAQLSAALEAVPDDEFVIWTGGRYRAQAGSLRSEGLKLLREVWQPVAMKELLARAARVEGMRGYDPKALRAGVQLHQGSAPAVMLWAVRRSDGAFVARKRIPRPDGARGPIDSGDIILGADGARPAWGHSPAADVGPRAPAVPAASPVTQAFDVRIATVGDRLVAVAYEGDEVIATAEGVTEEAAREALAHLLAGLPDVARAPIASSQRSLSVDATTRVVVVTEGNLRNSYLHLGGSRELFEPDVFGGANAEDAAHRTLRLDWDGGGIDTDIDSAKNNFRARGAIRQFFQDANVVAGDRVLIVKLGPYRYRLEREGGAG
jgi:hypothetical protein